MGGDPKVRRQITEQIDGDAKYKVLQSQWNNKLGMDLSNAEHAITDLDEKDKPETHIRRAINTLHKQQTQLTSSRDTKQAKYTLLKQ